MHHLCGWSEGEIAEVWRGALCVRGHTSQVSVLLLGLCCALPTWEAPQAQLGHPQTRPREPQPFRPVVLQPEPASEPPAGLINTGMSGSLSQSF